MWIFWINTTIQKTRVWKCIIDLKNLPLIENTRVWKPTIEFDNNDSFLMWVFWFEGIYLLLKKK